MKDEMEMFHPRNGSQLFGNLSRIPALFIDKLCRDHGCILVSKLKTEIDPILEDMNLEAEVDTVMSARKREVHVNWSAHSRYRPPSNSLMTNTFKLIHDDENRPRLWIKDVNQLLRAMHREVYFRPSAQDDQVCRRLSFYPSSPTLSPSEKKVDARSSVGDDEEQKVPLEGVHTNSRERVLQRIGG